LVSIKHAHYFLSNLWIAILNSASDLPPDNRWDGIFRNYSLEAFSQKWITSSLAL